MTRALTPKQKVLRKYPEAFCESNGPMLQIVSPLPYGRVVVLGSALNATGTSQRRAWAAASRALEDLK